MTANNFHEHMVEKAQERLRIARADYEHYATRVDWDDRNAVQHLNKLKAELNHAEQKLADAEHSLRCVQAMQRAVSLGM